MWNMFYIVLSVKNDNDYTYRNISDHKKDVMQPFKTIKLIKNSTCNEKKE